MLRSPKWVLGTLILGLFIFSSPVVIAETFVFTDQTGDLFDGQGRPAVGEKCVDIMQVEFTRTGSIFTVRIKMADSLPAGVANSSVFFEWDMLVDYDQDVSTYGWGPWPLIDNGIGVDILARVTLGSSGYTGEALRWVDSQRQRQNIDFKVDGSVAEMRFDASAMPIPKAFDFVIAAREYVGDKMIVADKCPNEGHFTFTNGRISLTFMKFNQPVVAVDYSFYRGGLDSKYRPVTRVNGYLKNETTPQCFMRIRYLADVSDIVVAARWYGPDGSLIREITGKDTARKVGDNSVWTLRATQLIRNMQNNTGIWRLEAYHGSYPLFTEYFSVGDYLASVSVTGFPAKSAVKIAIDGKEAGTIRGGEKKTSALAAGTHTISVNPAVNATSDMRFLTDSNSWTVSSEGTHTFEYSTQYYLRVDSPQGKTTGSGWYKEGSKAAFSTQSPVAAGTGVRYVFTKWTGDYESDSLEGNILMDRGKNVTANYKTQYELKVESEYGNPQGSGWYDQGATASFSVTSPNPASGFMGSLGAKMIFDSWSGDSKATTESGSVTMNSPKKVTATWSTSINLVPVALCVVLPIVAMVVVVGLAYWKIRPGKRRLTSLQSP